jgi:hypothetical protein
MVVPNLCVVDFRVGSHLAVKGPGGSFPLLGVKRKKPSPKPTSSITHSKPVAVLADENAEPGMVIWKAVQRDLMNGANRRDARGLLHRLHKGLRI